METMPQTTEVEQFLTSIGPFYVETDDSDSHPDPTTHVTMETLPLAPVAETNDAEASVSEQVKPKPTNQIADEEGEGESDDGESGAESDSSIDFKDSFQELSVSDWVKIITVVGAYQTAISIR